MTILLPMAGAGSRFIAQGYKQSKPVIPTTDRHTGKKLPMVVAAVNDLPRQSATEKIVFVIRDFHQRDGVPEIIKQSFPNAEFIAVDKLTEGQASTCLMAKSVIDNAEPLLIAACDNGMDVDWNKFAQLIIMADAIIFTFRNNEVVCEKPQAYGWIKTDGDDAIGISIKKPISDQPMNDHAVVGTFWFRHGHDFVQVAEAMIAANDRINNEFYVDQVFKYMIEKGQQVKVMEVDRYICWGTPEDYEAYEATIDYWKTFIRNEAGKA